MFESFTPITHFYITQLILQYSSYSDHYGILKKESTQLQL